MGVADETDNWSQWLDEAGPALVLLARQWTPDRSEAEDIVHDGFVRFWRSRDRAADPRAYLFACVKRAGLDRVRSNRRRQRRELAAAKPESEPPQQWFAGPLEDAERRAAVELALASLPAEQREVVVMRVWGALTIPQIAEVLGVPVNTASSRWRYGLAALRGRLKPEVIE